MALTITPHWENSIWYETEVLLALRDLAEPGDVFFDVGANVGGISNMMSPEVGPAGKIIAFEASPRTIGVLHTNMAGIHATNVHIVYAAVSDEDGGWLPFYYGHIPNADSLIDTAGSGNAVYVKSISLDAFIKSTDLKPDVIKMDIEGAEYRALMGMESYIPSKYPPFVLEVSNSKSQSDELLKNIGYKAISLSTYLPFNTISGSFGHSNVIYIHPSNSRGRQYLTATIESVAEFSIDNIIQNSEADFSLPLGDLEEGRYIIEFYSSEKSHLEDSKLEVAVGVPNQILGLQIAPLKVLCADQLRMVVHLDRRLSAYIILKGLSRDVLSQSLSGGRITRVRF